MEVKKVMPELVKDDNKGNLSVNYSGLLPILIVAVKEHQKQNEEKQQEIDELKKNIDELNARLQKLENMFGDTIK